MLIWSVFYIELNSKLTFWAKLFCHHQVIKRRYVGDWAMVSYVQVVADAKTTRFYVNALAKQWKRLEREEFNTALIKQHIPLDGKKGQMQSNVRLNQLR